MILQALCNYYDRLADDPKSGVARMGYARMGVSSCIVINEKGEVVSVRSLCKKEGEKLRPGNFIVPEQPKRSGSKPAPAFLCENAAFIFGIYKNEEGAKYRFDASKNIHSQILEGLDDAGAKALRLFFDQRVQGNYNVDGVDTSPLDEGGNIIFQLQGDMDFLHERPAIRKAWVEYKARLIKNALVGQCLVTGERGPIARIHGNISGFGQDKPTLVAFKQPSFNSFHKKQGMNAPVSEAAAFKYITALNCMMLDRNHHINLHGDKLVFWADRDAPMEETLVACFFHPDSVPEDFGLDEASAARVRGILSFLYKGKLPEEETLDRGVRFYVLGISANKTRLVIRFFYTDTFGEIEERVKKHYCDIYVDGMRFQVSPYRILLETAVGRESGNVASNLSGALMQSILNGSSYPFSLYQALLRRIRAEGGKDPQKAKGYAINAIRVGVLKGYLNRIDRLNQKKERINVALNLEERDVAYVLGRLFALLEKAQKDALGEVNASIVDKYLNSALATPQMVFPMLLALSKTHTSKTDKKSEGKNYGRYTDRRIAEVVDLLPSSGFPVNLNAEQQGRFIIGYYHQNQALYAKKIKEGQVEVSNEKEEM